MDQESQQDVCSALKKPAIESLGDDFEIVMLPPDPGPVHDIEPAAPDVGHSFTA